MTFRHRPRTHNLQFVFVFTDMLVIFRFDDRQQFVMSICVCLFIHLSVHIVFVVQYRKNRLSSRKKIHKNKSKMLRMRKVERGKEVQTNFINFVRLTHKSM